MNLGILKFFLKLQHVWLYDDMEISAGNIFMLLLVNKHSLVEENLDGMEPREWFNSEMPDKN